MVVKPSSLLLVPEMIAAGLPGSVTSATSVSPAPGTRTGRAELAAGGGAGWAGLAGAGWLGAAGAWAGAVCARAPSSVPRPSTSTTEKTFHPATISAPVVSPRGVARTRDIGWFGPAFEASGSRLAENTALAHIAAVMSALANRRFLKMNGLGNEIVIVDLRGTKLKVAPAEARAIAADPRSRFDQLMAIHDPRTPDTDAFLRIYNTDGSESGACGNGTRCVAWAMRDDPVMAQPGDGPLLFETRAGLLPVSRDGDRSFKVDMGRPLLRWDEIPLRDPFQDTRYIELQIGPIDAPILHSPSTVSMGNPHAIFWVDDVAAYDLSRIGPMLENHPIFPERANISLAQVVAPDRILLRVWERGAGLTKACGSAACAALVAAARKKLTGREATVTLPGGDLLIEWREDDHVTMTGPVELEWEGVLSPSLFAGAA